MKAGGDNDLVLGNIPKSCLVTFSFEEVFKLGFLSGFDPDIEKKIKS